MPESWVRGFLQVQAAMGMPGIRLDVQPIDLLAAVRYLRYTKARMSPRALRYEFEPGQDARLVLEPWEHVVPLAGAVAQLHGAQGDPGLGPAAAQAHRRAACRSPSRCRFT